MFVCPYIYRSVRDPEGNGIRTGRVWAAEKLTIMRECGQQEEEMAGGQMEAGR